MKFLTVPRLQKLSAMMQAVDVGDRIVHARVEAYSCKLAGSDKRAAKEITHAVDSQLSHSAVALQQHASLANSASQTPLGDLHEPSTKQLLVSLITTLNASFPDYDFSNLRAEQFQRDASPQAAMNAVNNLFVTAMESALGVAGFRDELWSALEETVFLHECEIYKFDGLSGEGDLSSSGEDAGKLWSINYFFFHRKQKKMVLLSSEAISKLHLQNTHSQAYQNAMRSRALHHGSHDDADDEHEFLSESESANSGGLDEDDDAMEAAEEEMLQELAADAGAIVPQQGGAQGSYVDASLLEWESVPDAEQNHQQQIQRQQQQQQQQMQGYDNLQPYESSPSHSSTSSASTVRVRPLPDTAHSSGSSVVAHMPQVRLASTKSPQMRAATAVGKSFANPILLGGSSASSSSSSGSMLPPRQGLSMFGGAHSSFSSVGTHNGSSSSGAASPNMRPAVPLFFQQQ